MTSPEGPTENPVVKLSDELPAPAVLEPKPEKPIAIEAESQLFADDHLIARKASVHRRLNRPHKQREPFLVPDREWEGQSILYSCIVENDGEYWLYYKARDWRADRYVPGSRYSRTPICLARSSDARTFHKEPPEGAAVDGTNIVINDAIDSITVYRDDAESDPEKRFKLVACRGRNWREGLTPAWSADGLRWSWGQDYAIRYFGDRSAYWYDPVRKKHVAWSRDMQLYRSRVIVHAESDDFETWSHPRMAVMPDRLDHPDVQIYGGCGFWYRSLYFAYLEIYHVEHQRLDTELACSRDGLNWQRLCEHDVFLPNGEHGEFDAYWIVPAFNPPIPRDGKLLIHYNGRPDPHTQAGFAHVPPGMGGALALAELREDGFVSLDATGRPGIVETVLLQPPEGCAALEVNVCPFNTRPGYDPMEVVVEILGGSGETVGAYQIRPSDDPDRVWYGIAFDAALPAVVRLRFRLKNARLYSFRFGK